MLTSAGGLKATELLLVGGEVEVVSGDEAGVTGREQGRQQLITFLNNLGNVN